MYKLKSVLLIDDDVVENMINRRLLEKMAAAESITILSDGREGIRHLEILMEKNNPPDLILVDINMPVLDGFGFLREFHKFPESFKNEIKVIVLTSSISEDDLIKVKEIGCDGFLNKPLTKEILDELKIFS